MLIDWFTVVAQIVNFLILVGLLKHFLYGPLVGVMDAREKRIADRLADAADKNREADQRIEHAEAETTEVERRRVQILAEAQAAGDQKRRELFEKARESVRALETNWRLDLDREKAAFLTELRQRASTEILSTTRRAVADLASTTLERAAIDVFLDKLQSQDAGTLQSLTGPDFSVFSPAELPEEVRGRIRDVIDKRLGVPTGLRFENDPAMAWGIELRGNGQRIGWTADTYLDSLDANLKMVLDRRTEETYGIAVGQIAG